MKIEIYYTDIIAVLKFEEQDGKIVGGDTDEAGLNYRLVWSGTDQNLNLTIPMMKNL